MGVREAVYLGHDNSVDLVLKANGAAVDLSSVTKVTLSVGGATIESVGAGSGPIRWAQNGYQAGEVRLFLGDQSLSPSSADQPAWITVYDSTNPEGVVWGRIGLKVIGEVEVVPA
jgi:hypothetical protein